MKQNVKIAREIYYHIIDRIVPSRNHITGKQHILNIVEIQPLIDALVATQSPHYNLMCAGLPYEEIDIKRHGDVILKHAERTGKANICGEFFSSFAGQPNLNVVDHAWAVYHEDSDYLRHHKDTRLKMISNLQKHCRALIEQGGPDEEIKECKTLVNFVFALSPAPIEALEYE